MTKRLFTEIADVYDRMNHLLSLGADIRWRKAAVSRVTVKPTKILDVACGTGDLTLALARQFPRAAILGTDLTPAMLEVARHKSTSPQIAFAEANAERLASAGLAFAPGTVELAACAFGFRNFDNKKEALRQIRQMMAPGGELLVLEFFRPRHRLMHALTASWLALLARCFVPSKTSAYAYLRESMRTTLAEDDFVDLAAGCGLQLVSRQFWPPCCSCLLFKTSAATDSRASIVGRSETATS